MCTIALAPILQNRTLPVAGRELYNVIVAHLNDCDKIVIDMTNVISLPSIFLNVSIGRFIEEYGEDALKQKINFTNISKVQAFRLKEYLRRILGAGIQQQSSTI